MSELRAREYARQDERPLDAAELVVYERLRRMGCEAAVDPLDPEDCADVAGAAVDALRKAGMLASAHLIGHRG